MAGIRKKGDGYHCTFRFQGKRYYFSLSNVPEAQALAKGAEVDETLALIERGRLTIPEGVTLEDFVAAGGKAPVISARPDTITARQLFDHYLTTHANGTVEESSLGTSRSHFNQIIESIGDRFRVQGLTLQILQEHVERRRKKGVAPVTLKKEMATFRGCWNWAAHGGLLKGTFPSRGLRFPKEKEKEPFRPYAEIETIITNEKPDEERQEALWQALSLTCGELEQFLEYVRLNATLPWLYPMVCFAAYTGARRSELLRALQADADLEAGIVTIREKKRLRGKRSTRTAPITPKLDRVLRDWLAVRPPSTHLFCQAEQVTRSKKKREAPTAVTHDENHDHLKRTTAVSKWDVMRGYHVLRHSFAANMVAAGVDQRIIDEILLQSVDETPLTSAGLWPHWGFNSATLLSVDETGWAIRSGQWPVTLQFGHASERG